MGTARPRSDLADTDRGRSRNTWEGRSATPEVGSTNHPLWSDPATGGVVRFGLFATGAGALTLVLAILTDLPERLTASLAATLANLVGIAAQTGPEPTAISILDAGHTMSVTPATGGTWVVLLLAAAILATNASWRERGIALAAGIPFVVVANTLVVVALGWLIDVAPRPALALAYFGRGAIDLLIVTAVWATWVAMRHRKDPDRPPARKQVVFLALLGVMGLWVLLGALGGLRGYGQALFGVSNEVAVMVTRVTREFGDIPAQAHLAQFGYQFLFLGLVIALFAATRGAATYRVVKAALLIGVPVVFALHVADLGFSLAYDAMVAKGEIPADSRAVGAGFSAATVVLRTAGAALPPMAWFAWRHREQQAVPRRAPTRDRTSRTLVGLLAILLVTSGCGSRIHQSEWVLEEEGRAPVAAAPVPETAQEQPEVAAEEPQAPDQPQGPAEEASPPEPDAPAAEAPAPDPAPDAEPPDDENLGPVPLDLAAEPDCVTNGDEVTVTARTAPGSPVGMIVGYSDYNHHGNMDRSVADDDGVVVWRFTVPRSAPPGEATVAAVSSTMDGERANSGETTFEVGGPLGCT